MNLRSVVSLVGIWLFWGDLTGASVIRGVDPALRPKYEVNDQSFHCLQSGKSIPVSRVNDNYCDCIDGSDEPGTSACPNGHFYCKNRGHVALTLNSSFVDDGYCDCCDGTDEAEGKCKNTCEEAGAENRAALRKKSSEFSTGLKLRRKYISQAGTQRKKWELELKQSQAKEAELQRQVNKLRGRKEQVEKIEAKEREQAELKRKLAEENKPSEETKPSEPTVTEPEPANSESTDTITGSKTSIADLQANPETPNSEKSQDQINREIIEEQMAIARQGADPEKRNELFQELTGREEAGKKEAESKGEVPLTAEELAAKKAADLEEEGRRIASQWTSDPSASSSSQEGGSEIDPPPPAPPADSSWEDSHPPDEEIDNEDSLKSEISAKSSKGFLARMKSFFSKTAWDEDTDFSWADEKSRQTIKDSYNTENGKLIEASRQKSDLEKKLGQDFGSEDVFLTLSDRCIDANVEKYVYQVCFFGQALQKDGGMSTSLGHFRRFEDDFKTMVYEGGQQCWNGPARSIRVALECGKKEELSGVDEPNKCEYRAKLSTPAVCNQEEYESVLRDLESMETQIEGKSEL